MTRRCHRGFVILLALAAIVSVGAAMVVFSAIASTMLHQACSDQTRAEARNVTLSTLDWARTHRDRQGQTVLDVSTLMVPDSSSEVTIGERGGRAVATVSAGCRRSQVSVRTKTTYELDAP